MKKTLITLAAVAVAFSGVAAAADYTFSVPVNGECNSDNGNLYAGDFNFTFMIHDAADVSTTGTFLASYYGEVGASDQYGRNTFTLTKLGNETDGYTFSLTAGRGNGSNPPTYTDSVVFTGLEQGVQYTLRNNTSNSTMYISLFTPDGQIGTDGEPGTERPTYEGKLNGWSTALNGQMKTSFNQTFAVPEPATATLSLLALASLAARRRRK